MRTIESLSDKGIDKTDSSFSLFYRVGKGDMISTLLQDQNKERGVWMDGEFTTEELTEALRAITSLASKCEKAQKKLTQGTSQHTLLVNRIKALHVASSLITNELVALTDILWV